MGLLWRFAPLGLPAFALKYGGSILWSAMLYCLGMSIRPFEMTRTQVAICATLIAGMVEGSRLVHTPALDAFRLTMPGALLLGRVFSIWDIAAYAVGIACAYACDGLLLRRQCGIGRS